jgi:hypothetical protein
MATYERLDYGSPDGSQWGGSSSDMLGMYGVTPVTQYASVGAASTYVIHNGGSSATASTSTWAFKSQAAFESMVTQVSTITVAGRLLGLWV